MNDGPTVKLELSCFDCKHVRTELYHVQGGSGTEVYCQHPDAERPGYVGDTHWRTPTWCPLRAAAITATVKTLGFVSIDSIKGVLPTYEAEGTITARENAATPGPWFSDFQPVGPCGAKCYRDRIITNEGKTIAVRPNAAFNGPGRAARIQEMADGAFMAHARTDIPWLLNIVANIRRVIGDDN